MTKVGAETHTSRAERPQQTGKISTFTQNLTKSVREGKISLTYCGPFKEKLGKVSPKIKLKAN